MVSVYETGTALIVSAQRCGMRMPAFLLRVTVREYERPEG